MSDEKVTIGQVVGGFIDGNILVGEVVSAFIDADGSHAQEVCSRTYTALYRTYLL